MEYWNGILESKINTINTRSDLGFHVLYCMGIKSVIASNNCTNADAGIYNMHQCDAVKGGIGLGCTREDMIMSITCYYYSSLRMFAE